MTAGAGISPEFLELIQRAARETISIPCESQAFAVKFRQRLHSARKHLFKLATRPSATPADAALASLAESIETAITNSNGIITLIVRPRDSQFRDALRAAGINVEPSLQPPPPSDPIKPEPVHADPMHAYLNRKE